MLNKEQEIAWNDIKNIWNKSSENKEIQIVMSQLIIELKDRTSQFEQDTIASDLNVIKRNISQFEKDAIKKDLLFIKQNISQFEKNFVKRIIRFLTKVLKKVLSIIKREKK